MRSDCRANQPSSGWSRLPSSSPITTSGSTTSWSPKRSSAPGSESRTEVSRTNVRRVVTSRLPWGAQRAPARRWPGPGAEAGCRPPWSTNSSAPTGPPVDGEGSSSSTADGRPAGVTDACPLPLRDPACHPEGVPVVPVTPAVAPAPPVGSAVPGRDGGRRRASGALPGTTARPRTRRQRQSPQRDERAPATARERSPTQSSPARRNTASQTAVHSPSKRAARGSRRATAQAARELGGHGPRGQRLVQQPQEPVGDRTGPPAGPPASGSSRSYPRRRWRCRPATAGR